MFTCLQNLATRFSHFVDMIVGVEIENLSCNPGHAHFWGGLSSDS